MNRTTDNGPVRGVIYARTAHEPPDYPGQRNDVIEQQIAACRRVAQRLGLTVTDVFTDRGVSGLRGERPGLRMLHARLADGDVQAVIMTEPARLSRRLADALAIEDAVTATGACVVYADAADLPRTLRQLVAGLGAGRTV